jgi:acyl carrier protein
MTIEGRKQRNMPEEEIFERLREVLAGFLDMDEDDITMESDLKGNLDLDPSYDEDVYDEIILEFFDIESELTAEDFEKADTVADLVDMIKDKLD